MTQHCEGEPTISPWRGTAQGTWYAIKVCACGEQAEYVEVEAQERSKESSRDESIQKNWPPL